MLIYSISLFLYIIHQKVNLSLIKSILHNPESAYLCTSPINKGKTQKIFKNHTATHEWGHPRTSSGHLQNVSATTDGQSCQSQSWLHLQDSGEQMSTTGTSVGCRGASPSLGSRRVWEAQELCLAPSPESRGRGWKGLWGDQTGWAGAWERTCVLGTPGRSVRTVDTQEPWKGPQGSASFAIPMSIKDLLVFSRKLLEGIVQVSVQVCVCKHQCFKWEQWATKKTGKHARSCLSHVFYLRSCLTLWFFSFSGYFEEN